MQTIIVDMTPGYRMPTIYFSQGDVGTQFAIDLRSRFGDSLPASPTVTIQATKPSGFGFTVAATSLTNGVAVFTTTAEMTDEAGRFPAELKVVKDNVTLFSANFGMEGEANTHPAGTIDGSQETVIPELTQLVERAEDAASSVLDRQTVTNTLPAGSQATYSFDEGTNTQTFGIPQGEAGAGAAGVTASAYSASKTYAVGDYVIHNSNLYRCTTAITTAEAFTAAHWTQVVLADDVSDVKSDLSQFGFNLGVHLMTGATQNKRINTTTGDADTFSSGYATDFIPVTAGKKYRVNFSYYSSGNYGMAFYKSDKTFLSGLAQTNNGGADFLEVFEFTAPENAYYARLTIVPEAVSMLDNIVMFDSDFTDAFASAYYEHGTLLHKYIASDGTPTDNSSYDAYRVDLSGCKLIKVNNYRYAAASNKTIAFYDANDTLIWADGTMNTIGIEKNTLYYIPKNTAYCYVSSRNVTGVELSVRLWSDVNAASDKNKDVLVDVVNEADNSKAILKNSLNLVGVKNLVDNSRLTTASRINTSTGAIENAASEFSATEFLEVEEGKQYYCNVSYYSSGNFGMAFYKADRTFLSGIKQSNDQTSGFNVFTFTVPTGAKYARLTKVLSEVPYDMVVAENNTNTDLINYVYPYFENDLENNAIGSNGSLVSNSNFRAIKISADGCKYVKVKSRRYSADGYKTIAFYQSDGTFIYSLGDMTTTDTTKEEQYIVPKNASYFIVSERAPSTPEYMTITLLMTVDGFNRNQDNTVKRMMGWFFDEKPIKKHEYYGEKIHIKNTYSFVKYGGNVITGHSGSISEPSADLAPQDCATYGDYLFCFYDKGFCKVYDIADMNDIEYVNSFELASYGIDTHSGNVSFAPYVISGNAFPLLYTPTLVNGSLACVAEKVTTSSSELIQTITFNITRVSYGLTNVWVGDDGFLYVQEADTPYSTDGVEHFYKFNLPVPSDGDVTLTDDDIVDSWVVANDKYIGNVVQTLKTINGNIFILFGTSNTDKFIDVYDFYHNLSTTIPLNGVISEEPEAMCAYDNSLLIQVNKVGDIYVGIWKMNL